MKKNKMMRAALALLVVTMLTMSVVSGTFAKYVTSGSASGTARVAKFGVVVSADGDLFSKTYMNAVRGNMPGSEGITVESSDEAKLVAPGTKSSAEGLKVSFTGTPEVDVRITLAIDDYKDVFLAGNDRKYPDMTTSKPDDQFKNESKYQPIKYTLSKNGTAIEGMEDVTIDELQTALGSYSVYVDSNKDLSKAAYNFNLTWKWDFETDNDKQDTLLGDLAAGTVPGGVASKLYSTDAAVTLSATVTQVD